MRNRLTPPERHDIPNGRHRQLRNFVISEIGQAGRFERVGRRVVAISVALFVLTSAGVAGAVLLNTEFDLETEVRSEEHTSEPQSHRYISYAGFRLKKKKKNT